jgi:hypothetical protein
MFWVWSILVDGSVDNQQFFYEWAPDVFSGFLHQWNRPPQYNWNIVESGIKHHNPSPSLALLNYEGISQTKVSFSKKSSLERFLTQIIIKKIIQLNLFFNLTRTCIYGYYKNLTTIIKSISQINMSHRPMNIILIFPTKWFNQNKNVDLLWYKRGCS